MISSFRKKQVKIIEADFVEMLEENKERFYRIAYSYVKNEHDALDVVQDSVCKGYSSLHKLVDQSYMKTWFTRIIINTAIDSLKKRRKVILYEQATLENEVDHKSERSEEKMDLRRALSWLKDKEKAIIILRFFEEYKLEEIAQTLDEPLNTIKTTLYRSLKKMKLNLEEEYNDDY